MFQCLYLRHINTQCNTSKMGSGLMETFHYHNSSLTIVTEN